MGRFGSQPLNSRQVASDNYTLPPVGPLVSTMTPVAVAAGVSNVKGSWVELVASTSRAVGFVEVLFSDANLANNARPALLDIGIGPAASETVLIADLCIGQASASTTGYNSVIIPISVNAGVRLSARIAFAAASAPSTTVGVNLYRLPTRSGVLTPSRVVTIGAVPASSIGVNTTAGSWVEITAATPQPFMSTVLSAGLNTASILGNAAHSVELGWGSAGAEETLSVSWFGVTTGENYSGYKSAPSARHIPAGSRLAVRTSASAPQMTVTVVGVPYA